MVQIEHGFVDRLPGQRGPQEQVLKYLARYTHRVALTNHRLLSCDEGIVRFTARDYAAGGRRKVVALPAEEFLRRWLQHVLPSGFVKIRHAGLLSNRGRTERLALCRLLSVAFGCDTRVSLKLCCSS